eukprot:gene21685-28708_t
MLPLPQAPLPPTCPAPDGGTRSAATSPTVYLEMLENTVVVAGEEDTCMGTFNRDQSHIGLNKLVLHFSCMFGGQPSWKEREARKNQAGFKRPGAAGSSNKVARPARTKARKPLPYAYELKLVDPKAGEEGTSMPPVSTITVVLTLAHSGHAPGCASDLRLLAADKRLIDKVQDLAQAQVANAQIFRLIKKYGQELCEEDGFVCLKTLPKFWKVPTIQTHNLTSGRKYNPKFSPPGECGITLPKGGAGTMFNCWAQGKH